MLLMSGVRLSLQNSQLSAKRLKKIASEPSLQRNERTTGRGGRDQPASSCSRTLRCSLQVTKLCMKRELRKSTSANTLERNEKRREEGRKKRRRREGGVWLRETVMANR